MKKVLLTLIAFLPLQQGAADSPEKDEVPWSFRPVVRSQVPTSKFDHLAKSTLDRFLFAKLAEKGLTPAPVADRLTLLRRVTVDLTGLLPTPEEVAGFLNACPAAGGSCVQGDRRVAVRSGERR